MKDNKLFQCHWEMLRLYQHLLDNAADKLRPKLASVFDDVIITYDDQEHTHWPIPVMKEGKCALISHDSKNTPLCDFAYDFIFREPYGLYGNYIAKKDGKWGIMNINGELVVPCIMDHIYERDGYDGVVILEKEGKYGFFNDCTYCMPEYSEDDIYVSCEEMVKVRKNGMWGWIDGNGKFTLDENEAVFSNYYDDDK